MSEEQTVGPTIEQRLKAREGSVRGLLRALERIRSGEWSPAGHYADLAIRHFTCNRVDHLFVEVTNTAAFTEEEIVDKFEALLSKDPTGFLKAVEVSEPLYQVTRSELIAFIKSLGKNNE